MSLKYLLPFIVGIAYIVSIVLLFKYKRKDNLRNFYCFLLLTGFVFSIVETYIIDDTFIKQYLFVFILLIILNSANCLLKGLVLSKTKVNEINKNFMLFDNLSLISIVILIFILRAK